MRVFTEAAPLAADPETLGGVENWQFEWKWDGLRCQVEKRGTSVELWGRGEDRLTTDFPELIALFASLPGHWTLDGEILPGEPLRGFLAYDLLRSGRKNLSREPLRLRREKLEKLLTPHLGDSLALAELTHPASWNEAAEVRSHAAEKGALGLTLKKLDAPYAAPGSWFQWKQDPLTVNAVLTAAQPGTRRRDPRATDFTFSIWKGQTLVPIAKAHEGLTIAETRKLEAWTHRHTLEHRGPARLLEVARVFELAFEGLAENPGHPAGFSLHFPRIVRERPGQNARNASRVEDLQALLRYLRGNHHPNAEEEGALRLGAVS